MEYRAERQSSKYAGRWAPSSRPPLTCRSMLVFVPPCRAARPAAHPQRHRPSHDRKKRAAPCPFMCRCIRRSPPRSLRALLPLPPSSPRMMPAQPTPRSCLATSSARRSSRPAFRSRKKDRMRRDDRRTGVAQGVGDDRCRVWCNKSSAMNAMFGWSETYEMAQLYTRKAASKRLAIARSASLLRSAFLRVELRHLVPLQPNIAFSSASVAPLSAAMVADALRSPWPDSPSASIPSCDRNSGRLDRFAEEVAHRLLWCSLSRLVLGDDGRPGKGRLSSKRPAPDVPARKSASCLWLFSVIRWTMPRLTCCLPSRAASPRRRPTRVHVEH